MKIVIPKPSGRICAPKIFPLPSSSRIAPASVSAAVKPRPMPMPSITESSGVCLLA